MKGYIEAFRTGKHRNASAHLRDYVWTDDDLRQMKDQFDPSTDRTPACVGHPATDKPAHGWFEDVQIAPSSRFPERNALWVKLRDMTTHLAQGIADHAYENVSLALWPGNRIRHLAFLGSEPGAVEGLAPIQFDAGEWYEVPVEFHARETSQKESPMTDEEKKAHEAELKKLQDQIAAKDAEIEKQKTEFAASQKGDESAEIKALKDDLEAKKTEIESQKTALQGLKDQQIAFAASQANELRKAQANALLQAGKITAADVPYVVKFGELIAAGSTDEIQFAADGSDKGAAEAHYWKWLNGKEGTLPLYRTFAAETIPNGNPREGEKPEPGSVDAAVENSKKLLEKRFGKQA